MSHAKLRAAVAADPADTVAVLAYLVQQCKFFPMDGNHALAIAEQHLAGRTMRDAFNERTEALTRSADECITLTNERNALRAALRRVLAASMQNSADAIAHAREVLQTISIRESGYRPVQFAAVLTHPAPTGIVGDGPGDTAF